MEVIRNENAAEPLKNDVSRWSKEMNSDSLKYWFNYYTSLFQNAIDVKLIPANNPVLDGLKYNLLNEGRGAQLHQLYKDILEYQAETNPVFTEDFEPPFGDAYQAEQLALKGQQPEPAEDQEEYEDLVLSRSQKLFIGEALKAWTNSKNNELTAEENVKLSELLESLYG